MEKAGFYNKGTEGTEAINPSKITAGQTYDTGLVFIYPATNNPIDDVDALYTGWIIFNENVNRWQEAGKEAIKGNWDASGGTLPSTNIIVGDKYIISVAGVVNSIQLNENDTIIAKINNPTASQTGGIFNDWTAVKAITVTSNNVSRPNGDSVEDSLLYLENAKVDIVVGKQLSTEDYTTAEKNKLAGIDENAQVNVNPDWNDNDNTSDAFINNKPSIGTVASKDVGNQVGETQENGAILGNSETVETDSNSKLITVAKNTAYNANFGTGNTDVARGDASYLKAITYTQSEVDSLLNAKENTADKGQANGYASLDGSAKVPASQLPSYIDDVEEYSNLASFPTTGENGKIYIALDTNLTYRWSGSTYVSLNDVDLSDYFNKTSDTTDDITEGNAKFTTQADIDKLAGIEANATADQTDAEIKTAYENNTNTNAFTDAEKTKLAGIDAGAEVNVQANLGQTDNTQDDYVAGKSTANIADSLDKRYITDAEKTVIGNTSGTNTGDETTSSIQTKRPLKTIENQSLEGAGNIDLTKSDVDLANVDNTSDVNKPVSTAQQTALDGKLAKASNLTDVTNRQISLNNLTNVASATDGDVLMFDAATGDAIFKPSSGGGGGGDLFDIGDYTQSARTTKSGWLLCNGQAVSRTTYSDLFSVISTSFGAGDGSTTFNIPDFRGKAFGAIGQGSGLTNRTLGNTVGQENVQLTASQSGLKAHTVSGNVSGTALANNGITNPNVGSSGAIAYVLDSNGALYNDGQYDGIRFYNGSGGYHEASDVDWVLKQDASLTFSHSVPASDALSSHENMQPTLFAGNIFIKY